MHKIRGGFPRDYICSNQYEQNRKSEPSDVEGSKAGRGKKRLIKRGWGNSELRGERVAIEQKGRSQRPGGDGTAWLTGTSKSFVGN